MHEPNDEAGMSPWMLAAETRVDVSRLRVVRGVWRRRQQLQTRRMRYQERVGINFPKRASNNHRRMVT